MERRFAVHAGSYRQALIAAIVLVVSPVGAAPKGAKSKAAFQKGVAAYQKNDYAAASAAFSKSYTLEADAETLFAWAQSERKQEHCDKATELYAVLLEMDLPAENKTVIKGQIAECEAVMAAQHQKTEPVKTEPEKTEPVKTEPVKTEPAKTEPVKTEAHDEVAPPVEHVSEGRPWYRDPVGDTLVITGVVGIGVGVAMLVSAHSAEQSEAGVTYPEAKALDDKAKSRGTIGVISGGIGAALVVGGIVWYATHGKSSHAPTAWVTPTGGGVGIAGAF